MSRMGMPVPRSRRIAEALIIFILVLVASHFFLGWIEPYTGIIMGIGIGYLCIKWAMSKLRSGR